MSAEADFAEFYQREFRLQFHRARLILDSTAVAEDVVQTAFAEIWNRWTDLDDPGPYLNRSVLNGARGRYQRDRRRRMILRTYRGREAFDDVAADQEVLSDVLAKLPFNQRSALVLRYYGGLSDTEIAEAMACPTGSVGPWIHRGLATLRKALS